ncbi:MAG: hypothetical protein HC853_11235, partial [Anaerolineae bacterium]|nr:hypothetical protein [Anaerolineae bacterium]
TAAPAAPTTAPPQATTTTAEQPSPVAPAVTATTETPTEAPSTDTPAEPTEASPGAVRVQVGGRVRSGPSTSFAIVANDVSAEAIAFTQVGREVWYQVKLADGRTGWANSSVVQTEDSTDEAALERLPEATDVPPTPVLLRPRARLLSPLRPQWRFCPPTRHSSHRRSRLRLRSPKPR